MSLSAVLELLRARAGLEAEPLGARAVEAAVAARLRALNLADLSAYAGRLAGDAAEMAALIDAVVVPETWFFRGGDLFAHLTRHLRAAQRRPARALSLPCSTGEEPYSLAIALADVGAACSIDGVDISPRNVEAARRGLFPELSFRQTPDAVRRRHFRPSGPGWEIEASLRRSVRFAVGNLLDPGLLLAAPYDVVLCRNLFIYLGPAARRRGLDHLAKLVAPGGLLALGHAEPLAQTERRFEPFGPPEQFLYRRLPPPAAVVVPAAPKPPAPAKHCPRPAAAAAPPVTLHQARLAADEGRYAEALDGCARLLDAAGPSADVYALIGVVRQAQHRPAEASESLDRALYLDPCHRDALFHLMLLCQEQGDAGRAAVLRRRLDRCYAESR